MKNGNYKHCVYFMLAFKKKANLIYFHLDSILQLNQLAETLDNQVAVLFRLQVSKKIMNISSLIFLLQLLQVPLVMITHTEFTQDRNLQGKSLKASTKAEFIYHLLTLGLVFFFFNLGPCEHSQDIPLICPGQTSPSPSKTGIDSLSQPTSLEKTETNTL